MSLERTILGLQPGLLCGGEQQLAEEGRRSVERHDVDVAWTVRRQRLLGFGEPDDLRGGVAILNPGTQFGDGGIVPGHVDEADLERPFGHSLERRGPVSGHIDFERGLIGRGQLLNQQRRLAATKQEPRCLGGRSLWRDRSHRG